MTNKVMCEGRGCTWYSTDCKDWEKTHGFCANCWLKLTPKERAILDGTERPETKVVTYSIPASPSLLTVYTLSFLGAATGVALSVLAFIWGIHKLGWKP